MLFVPLLVGTAVVTVAVMSRLEAVEERCRSRRPSASGTTRQDVGQNPLRHAYPHLRFWVPDDELLGREREGTMRSGSPGSRGTIGPDIIVGPWVRRPDRQNGSYADAA